MEESSKKSNSSGFFKEWLEKLQQESWQLELLISGFALFGIWEAKPFIETVSNSLEVNQTTGAISIIVSASISIIKAGWTIFFINLLIHIILRGLWIGAIGLRYVSNEIDYDALNYSDWMTDYLKRRVGNYDDYIERLEKLCSVIFAYTFLLFFIFLSAGFFFAEVGMIARLIAPEDSSSATMPIVGQSFLMVFVFLGVIVFIDFITLGTFKKVKDATFAKVYGWIYKFYSYATLSFLYRALLYNFLDEKYTKRLFLLSIPYVLCIVVLFPTFYSNAYPHFPKFSETRDYQRQIMQETHVSNYYYDDLREVGIKTGFISTRNPIRTMTLSNYEVSGKYLKAFIAMKKSDKEYLDNQGIASFFKDGFRSTILKNVKNDSVLTVIDSLRNEAKSPLLAERRQMRNDLKKEGLKARAARLKVEPIFKPSLDSIDQIYDELRDKEIRQRFTDVRTVILDLSEISIDGQEVEPNLDLANFYMHPNAGERGILYYIPIDSLSVGPHSLNIRRCSFNSKRGSCSYVDLTYPFMKIE